MSLEVELKYSVDNEQQFLASLAQLPVREGVTQRQVDHYFNHPERDFAATDEAFRIRIEGAEACLTYKGPKLDAETKTRREVEVPLLESGTAADRAFEMLCSL
ncbi:MAG: class IV adenylate cyclase, partial [Planctomycetota bacterium]|nr:class IV adenylate cyclase [Planctomycetota bacterium]MEC8510374.1 class IV adenylate cyclase [Planctomycetota bacterium]